MKNRWLVHIGYPKSASSTLQQGILSRHEDINYMSGEAVSTRFGNDAIEAFRFYKAIRGDISCDMTTMRKIWEKFYVPNADPSRLNIISTEYFIWNQRSPVDVARDLREIVGDADILMVVRDQASLLKSLYNMSPFFENDPRRKYLDFSTWLVRTLKDGDATLASRLRYLEVARTFADVFGLQRVHAVAFEKLVDAPRTLTPFCTAVGVNPDRFVELAGSTHLGDAESHAYKKLTRRILGRRKASSYLPPAILAMAKEVLRRTVPVKRTVLSSEDRTLINRFFQGNRPADLAELSLGTVIV